MTERRPPAGRPLALTLSAGLVFAILIALGVWQLQRLEWKNALIAEREAALAALALPLPSDLSDPAALELLKVRAEGRLLNDKALRLGPRPRARVPGDHLIVPFRLASGRILLVDRGWVPQAQALEPGLLNEPEGPLELELILREDGWRGSAWFEPANDPARGDWFSVDTTAMAEDLGLERVVPGIYAIQIAPEAVAGRYPIPVPPSAGLRNDHLQYALTWFALAAILAVIYLLLRRRLRGGERTPD